MRLICVRTVLTVMEGAVQNGIPGIDAGLRRKHGMCYLPCLCDMMTGFQNYQRKIIGEDDMLRPSFRAKIKIAA